MWLKLLVHERGAAGGHLQRDELGPCQKIFARCKAVLRQLTEMWSVLETLTPSDYMEFREVLGPSSGFQSLQYRTVEFLLGNKNAGMLKVFAHDAEGSERSEEHTSELQSLMRISYAVFCLKKKKKNKCKNNWMTKHSTTTKTIRNNIN